MKKVLVTVVFLARNAGPEFAKTLEAVLGQKTDFEFEILVLDNESTDGTWEWLLQEQQCVKVSKRKSVREMRMDRVPREEFGHGPTRNKAMEMAKGEIVVFLVQDAVPIGKKWLATLVEPLRGSVKVSKRKSVGGRVAGVSGRQIAPEYLQIAQEYFYQNSYADKPKVLSEVPSEIGPGKIWFTNVCSAVLKEAWLETKFPDIIQSEDQAWAVGVLKKGWKLVYEPRAKVIHGHHLTLCRLFKRMVDTGVAFGAMQVNVSTRGGGLVKYVTKEMVYGLKKQGLVGVWAVLSYELVRFFGLAVGKSKLVPWQVKRHFSNVPQWWDQR